MKGKALVALLSLAAGCATPNSAIVQRKPADPVGYQPIRPIATSINGGLASADPEAVRAGLAEGGQGPRPRMVAETNGTRAKAADPAVSTASTAPSQTQTTPSQAAQDMMPPQASQDMMPPPASDPTSNSSSNSESWKPPAAPSDGAELPPLPDLGSLPVGKSSSAPAGNEPSADSVPAQSPSPMTPPVSADQKREGAPGGSPGDEPSLPTLPDSTPSAAPATSDAEKPSAPEPNADQTSKTTPNDHRDPSLRRVAATAADEPVDDSNAKIDPSKLEGDAKRLRETKIDVPVRAPLSMTAATVGDMVITEQELVNSYRQWRSTLSPGDQNQIPEEVKNMKMDSILDEMIEQTMLYETAKRKVNNEKVWQTIYAQVDQDWRERELPKYLRRWHADNEYALAKKLADVGIDYDEIKEYYHREVLGYQFLGQSIQAKLKVDPPEIKRYYEHHLKDFARPARVTWREVLIDARRYPNRAEAVRKARLALSRLRRGEEFAKVARELSEGPNAAIGGIWPDTTPGSYSVPVVNDAVERAPLHRITPILEDERSFHIVRVEARRPAGPASFPEVENDIRELLRKKKQKAAWEAAMEKMRSKMVIDKRYKQTPIEIDPLNPLPARSDKSAKPTASAPASIAAPSPRG